MIELILYTLAVAAIGSAIALVGVYLDFYFGTKHED